MVVVRLLRGWGWELTTHSGCAPSSVLLEKQHLHNGSQWQPLVPHCVAAYFPGQFLAV